MLTNENNWTLPEPTPKPTLMKGKVMIQGWNMYEKMDGLTYSHL